MVYVFDIDGTLIDTPVTTATDSEIDKLQEWERRILEETFDPIEGAPECVAETIKNTPANEYHLLTTRSARLEKATIRNLELHFPGLAHRAHISFGHIHAQSGGFLYKMQRLGHIQARACGPITMYDNDDRVLQWLRRVDIFRYAPSCYKDIPLPPCAQQA